MSFSEIHAYKCTSMDKEDAEETPTAAAVVIKF